MNGETENRRFFVTIYDRQFNLVAEIDNCETLIDPQTNSYVVKYRDVERRYNIDCVGMVETKTHNKDRKVN